MAEQKLILLDCKILSLDLNALCEFALHAKVEKSVVEGKGKLSVIRSIRRKIEDSVEGLSDDDQIEFVDGLIAHLGPPPLKGMVRLRRIRKQRRPKEAQERIGRVRI